MQKCLPEHSAIQTAVPLFCPRNDLNVAVLSFDQFCTLPAGLRSLVESKPTCVARSLDSERSQVASLIGLVLEVTCTSNETFHTCGWRIRTRTVETAEWIIHLCVFVPAFFRFKAVLVPYKEQTMQNWRAHQSSLLLLQDCRIQSFLLVLSRIHIQSLPAFHDHKWFKWSKWPIESRWSPIIPISTKPEAAADLWPSWLLRELGLPAVIWHFLPKPQSSTPPLNMHGHAKYIQIHTNTPTWSDMPLPY